VRHFGGLSHPAPAQFRIDAQPTNNLGPWFRSPSVNPRPPVSSPRRTLRPPLPIRLGPPSIPASKIQIDETAAPRRAPDLPPTVPPVLRRGDGRGPGRPAIIRRGSALQPGDWNDYENFGCRPTLHRPASNDPPDLPLHQPPTPVPGAGGRIAIHRRSHRPAEPHGLFLRLPGPFAIIRPGPPRPPGSLEGTAGVAPSATPQAAKTRAPFPLHPKAYPERKTS